MGTNYYAVVQTCDDPRHAERVHIGKQSHGWRFLFRKDNERGLTSPGRWQNWLCGKRIVDEYGDEVDLHDLFDRIYRTRKRTPHDTVDPRARRFVVADMVEGEFS